MFTKAIGERFPTFSIIIFLPIHNCKVCCTGLHTQNDTRDTMFR